MLFASSLFGDSWIFDRYGEKGKNTPDFFVVFSNTKEAESWLSESNLTLSDLRELEPLLGYLQNDMGRIVKSGYVMIFCIESISYGDENFYPSDYYVIP